jgi:hypothetical protein
VDGKYYPMQRLLNQTDQRRRDAQLRRSAGPWRSQSEHGPRLVSTGQQLFFDARPMPKRPRRACRLRLGLPSVRLTIPPMSGPWRTGASKCMRLAGREKKRAEQAPPLHDLNRKA